jgi:hypothetical protein
MLVAVLDCSSGCGSITETWSARVRAILAGVPAANTSRRAHGRLNDEEPGEVLPLPEVDQIDQWPDVDPDLVAEAATSSLVLTTGSWTHPLTYRRGSRKRDLVARPLRTVREWLVIHPALVSEPLGGDWRDPSEWQRCMGPKPNRGWRRSPARPRRLRSPRLLVLL